MTTTKLTPPADLDVTRLHSPAEVDSWKARWLAYNEAVRAEEAAERLKQRTAETHANRVLSRDEAYAEAVKREAAAKAKEAARQAAQQAEQDAAAAYLTSTPETAEITADNPYHALVKLESWIAKGYRVTDNSVQCWLPNFIHVVLAAPAAAEGGTR